MEMFYLEKVSKERKKDIIEYIREMYLYKSRINGVGRLQDYVDEERENFDNWFDKIKKEETENIPKICYLFIKKGDNKIIGMTNIRMAKDLGDYPYGHVGYSIRPTERNKGYGKLQLYLALKELEKNGIYRCQMNCENNNENSRKIIKSLGGIFGKTEESEEYYLIDVSKTIKENIDLYKEKIYDEEKG